MCTQDIWHHKVYIYNFLLFIKIGFTVYIALQNLHCLILVRSVKERYWDTLETDTVRGGNSIRVDKTRYCSDYIDIGHKSKNFGIYSLWAELHNVS